MNQYTITEVNDWEGETFGYIVNITEDTFQRVSDILQEISDSGEAEVSIASSSYTPEQVELVNNHSSNTYMERLGFYEITNSLTSTDYSNFPYKGNGLKRVR